MPQAIVLGAGAAGLSTALQLQRRGWSVTLMDRNGVGLETSYGNAGIIQNEAVEPYAMPRDITTLLTIAAGRSNDVHYSLLTLPRHAGSLLRYWWHSAPSRHRRISAVYSGIIAAAAGEHQKLISGAGAERLVRRDGFRALYRSQAALDTAAADAERLARDYCVAFKTLTSSELGIAEPALLQTGAGALHWLDAWTVSDPGGLMKAYGDLFRESGGSLVAGDAASLRQTPGGGWSVNTEDGPVEAAHAVIALGPWSPPLLRPFGYRFPMLRKRGYHMHYRMKKPLDLPLLDDAFGYVMAPMAKGLRITTGAELAAENGSSTPIQLKRAERAATELVDLGAPVENRPWTGIRPCIPDMLPVIGAAPQHKGLWMHFGHGHQGFTLGPATGRLLSELMSGEAPYVDATPFRPDRF